MSLKSGDTLRAHSKHTDHREIKLVVGLTPTSLTHTHTHCRQIDVTPSPGHRQTSRHSFWLVVRPVRVTKSLMRFLSFTAF